MYNAGGNYNSTSSSKLKTCATPTATPSPAAPGCIESSGEIIIPATSPDITVSIFALYDNGTLICDNNESGTYTITCRPGYTVELDSTGEQMTYTSPGGTEVVGLTPSSGTEGLEPNFVLTINWNTLGSCANA